MECNLYKQHFKRQRERKFLIALDQCLSIADKSKQEALIQDNIDEQKFYDMVKHNLHFVQESTPALYHLYKTHHPSVDTISEEVDFVNEATPITNAQRKTIYKESCDFCRNSNPHRERKLALRTYYQQLASALETEFPPPPQKLFTFLMSIFPVQGPLTCPFNRRQNVAYEHLFKNRPHKEFDDALLLHQFITLWTGRYVPTLEKDTVTESDSSDDEESDI